MLVEAFMVHGGAFQGVEDGHGVYIARQSTGSALIDHQDLML